MNEDIKIINDFRSDAKIIFMALDQLMDQLKTSEAGEEAEEIVHDLRVHIRKLISLLYFYRPLLKKESFRALNRDFKILLRSFGYLRNQHVFKKHMEKYIEESGEDSALLTALMARQDMENTGINKEKDHLEPLVFRVIYENTLKIMLGFGEEIFRKSDAEKQGLEEKFVLSRYSELMKDFGKMENNLDFDDEKEVHGIRVTAKNIYYTLKAKEEKLGELAARRVEHLKDIQNIAGRIHDADVHLRILDEFQVEPEEKEVFERFLDYIRRERSVKLKELRKVIGSKPVQIKQ